MTEEPHQADGEGHKPSEPIGESLQVERQSLEDISVEPQLSLMQEFWLFIRQEKKWWLVPIMLVLGTLGLLAMLVQTGAAPFIYTLF